MPQHVARIASRQNPGSQHSPNPLPSPHAAGLQAGANYAAAGLSRITRRCRGCSTDNRQRSKERSAFRIGYLAAERSSTSPNSRRFHLVQEMARLGYVDGKNLTVEWRFADWQFERLPDLARDLVRLKVDVIVATTQLAVRAAQNASSHIPIVMAVSTDPVRMGLVNSLARPGGNTTGISSANDETVVKQLELLRSMVPSLSRVAYLINAAPTAPPNPYLARTPSHLDVAAQKLGIDVQRVTAQEPVAINSAFDKMTTTHVNALIVASNYLFNAQRMKVARLALDHKLPSISQRAEYAAAGGLMSYGESASEFGRRTAYFVDKILKGAKPADLPVELPVRFQLVINQKTAYALQLSIPTQLQTIADEIIE
jgi:putative ABC transport system substrate-binding protein